MSCLPLRVKVACCARRPCVRSTRTLILQPPARTPTHPHGHVREYVQPEQVPQQSAAGLVRFEQLQQRGVAGVVGVDDVLRQPPHDLHAVGLTGEGRGGENDEKREGFCR